MKIIQIGRSPSNNVVINDHLVSKTHCQIIKDDSGNFRLVDTNSTNGTFVNGVKRSGEVFLNQSDIVRIGNTTLPWQTYFANAGESTPNGVNNQQPAQAKPSNYLIWAILSTIFCCLPLGIVSIVYATKVDNLWYAGNYAAATDAADKAKLWMWITVGVGIVLSVSVTYYYVWLLGYTLALF